MRLALVLAHLAGSAARRPVRAGIPLQPAEARQWDSAWPSRAPPQRLKAFPILALRFLLLASIPTPMAGHRISRTVAALRLDGLRAALPVALRVATTRMPVVLPVMQDSAPGRGNYPAIGLKAKHVGEKFFRVRENWHEAFSVVSH